MLARLVLWASLPFLTFSFACSGPDGETSGSSSNQTNGSDRGQTSLTPLADEVADAICSLSRGSRERDLVALLGEPAEREDAAGMIALRWRTATWNADAMFRAGKLQLAGAYALQPRNSTKKSPSSDHPTWVAGQTRLEEMEAHLGPGVRVGVQWQAGVEVAPSIRNRPGFDDSITRDRCSDRYAWVDLNMRSFASLVFRDGVLQGGF